ncbi:type VI secretion system ImpA family N-terminal domain-containing protein [Enterobacteriaceae bacterium H20N1]|uniref:Type VI secretion system ImpA family N-terminal domain-containing protein n=1 Tax=Dryocola boscaweniae TaxID=2925397 RepID=A0A9X3AD97_9ENTR|nr:VasL domain-containing protein [Dryocola boscaweniae]MCT4702678.1 type VI secretion system ImpA family N-terminal domain-containing protein [Dryocola boscaweniae]MCT4719846.1 type VI secretion system ImpA family N-terminal domain-containing protein [Dryocola boscaweniae]
MNDITSRKIKTGGDPRTLPDYAALRDELSKLTHPARPDVNWSYAEKLCLSLFETNGVEMQTAAWYTLARTQLAGVFGLNEGLAILEALISHQWEALWPQPVHARMEILSSLSQRLQQRMRSLPLNYSDLSQLYRAEQLLTGLGEVLQRLELKHLSQLDTLRTLMHSSVVRLENSDGITSTGPNIQPSIVLPATVMNDATTAMRDLTSPAEDTPDSAVKWVYVAQPEQQPNGEVLAATPTPVKKWKSFAAGMCAMLVISTVAVWSWQYLHRPDPLQTQLAASLAPLPAPLAPEKLDMLRQQTPLPKELIAQTQKQLARLDKLPPDWNITYSRKLTEQALVLWPEQAKPLIQQWQQQVNVSALSTDAMDGWHEGMIQLQALADKLNALDGQKGKYITVSELKSQVFGMLTSFRRTVPLEEQFRLLNQLPEDSLQRQQQISQAEQHLRAQIYTLVQERQRD